MTAGRSTCSSDRGMIGGRTIICIANRWDYDPTSKHQVMRVLARRNRIVWVNYRGTRKPRASLADVTAAASTLRAALAGARRVCESIVQVTPLVIPGARRRGLRALSRRLLVAQIRRVLTQLPSAPVQIWTFAPDVSFLAGEFGEECLLYYCVDEYTAFEDFDGQAIQAAERRLIEKADAVVTTSAALYESKRQLHPRTFLVRHGVEAGHFAAAVERGLTLPGDLAGLPRPMFGFFGLIHHWFDVELLAAVARARPEASFVLLGDCRADVGALNGLANVHLLGRREYSELPTYCSAFDVALLPFRINEMTRNINPIKLREYLAAGLPVVSTPLPEARRYGPDVFVAQDCDTFCRQCDLALQATDPRARRRRSARVADESWEAVVERLSGIVVAETAKRRHVEMQNRVDAAPALAC
ncbi:MAG: glycosyltransferase [Planctomycetota bacterium]